MHKSVVQKRCQPMQGMIANASDRAHPIQYTLWHAQRPAVRALPKRSAARRDCYTNASYSVLEIKNLQTAALLQYTGVAE
eukprot:365466-Chlamydomonas_euryale.AAC.7